MDQNIVVGLVRALALKENPLEGKGKFNEEFIESVVLMN